MMSLGHLADATGPPLADFITLTLPLVYVIADADIFWFAAAITLISFDWLIFSIGYAAAPFRY